ncbi:NAD(P)/FAD-dependent oxidoreductase [Nocardioides sp. BP30]|uniref:flavin-containing monooxygenase n=1 Tax=Nocardioides sp. BP30 TaxID=3036374 RepID=UPI0024692A58|nr:NAD(P)/FAD-dependent oxidoreductase [Nocardioides sp. BP30]WGL52702.1 NAD(P)/FAD-dependent oxidoreductase [Nocardioides sp. BP30]
MSEHVDVLIVGAGLSGIGAAAQLRQGLPELSVAVLEGREASGGTWDLFRYPGIRSDSDMFTFGFRWHPWPSDRSLADGHMILDYLHTIEREYGVDELIRYQHTVTAADWDTAAKQWTVTATTPEGEKRFTANFLWACAGYYDYDEGHKPQFPGLAEFEGTFVHPQHWPEDLDYTGKKVVVIGSGATAVTLVPAMADRAEHITMLQRTPTYIMSRPAKDPLARLLGGSRLPDFVPFKGLRRKAGYEATRWANILILVGSYQLSRRKPELMKRMVRKNVVEQLTARPGQPGMSEQEAEAYAAEHFSPPYDPWDQRLCVVPDGDLFRAIRKGRASVVTDRIRSFTAKGIELESGETLEADIVISATGLRIKLFGGVQVHVDGKPVDVSQTMSYKALMLSGVPNFAFTIGYTNASWTLKADLVGEFVVKLLRHMRSQGFTEALVERDPSVGERPFMDLASGYIQRAAETMPRQGDRAPWMLKQNYLADLRVMGRDVEDGVIRFS